MVDVIKIFTRAERPADHKGNLPGYVTRVLNTFSTVEHHQQAKDVQLNFQLIKQLKTSPDYKETSEGFSSNGNHVVHYSCHECSGTWCDSCIEQKLVKEASHGTVELT